MKAVIPAAGLGTRFLPATKSQPKEMLPVVDKPTIQYVIEEVASAGINDILIITGRGKRAIEDHFDRAIELEYILKKEGKEHYLSDLDYLMETIDIYFIRQKVQRGLGDAILCASKHVGNEPFVVVLGDTILRAQPPCTKQLIELYNKYKSSIIAVEEVPMEKVSSYGIIKGKEISDGVYKIEDLVEKPSIKEAPSNLGIIGAYLLTPEIFDCIRRTPIGKNNEVQLTDAIKLLSEIQPIYAYKFKGRRYDIGNKLDWLKATIEMALEREEFSPQLEPFIKELIENKNKTKEKIETTYTRYK